MVGLFFRVGTAKTASVHHGDKHPANSNVTMEFIQIDLIRFEGVGR